MNCEMCIFLSKEDPSANIEYNIELIKELSKKFGSVTIINFINIEKNQEQINRKNQSYSDIKFFSPKNNQEFLEYIKNKKIFAMDSLNKEYFNFFKIRNLVNQKNIYLFSIISTGGISNQVIKISKSNLSHDLKNKFIRLVYRFLVLINYLPAIDFYFDPRKEIIEFTNLRIKKLSKIQNIFKQLNITYFKECYRINCRSYNNFILNKNKLQKKKIIFIDGNYKHLDIEKRNGKISEKKKNIYFHNLERTFQHFEKKFNLKVDICLHPSSDQEVYKDFFKNRNVYLGRTSNEIVSAEVILFHESGSVTDAIVQKKIIVSLETKLLGRYYHKRIVNFKNLLNLFSVNIDQHEDLNKNQLLEKFKNSLKNYETYIDNYLRSDDITSDVKIAKILYDKAKNNGKFITKIL